MKKARWMIWLAISVLVVAYVSWTITLRDDKSELLIGEATYGHYQIEMACGTCHTQPFGGREVLQEACIDCHAEELEEAHDSHPRSKFTDPREASRLEILDARYCITCHTEHQREQTLEMGVTLAGDYCYYCHQEVGEERPSHRDLPFDSCASAGCHNFHDNRALYESFLVQHAGQPWLKDEPLLVKANNAFWTAAGQVVGEASSREILQETPHDWQGSAHQLAGMSCASCHRQAEGKPWLDKPAVNECQACHAREATSYLQGRHGMRLALSGDPEERKPVAITPGESHMAFQADALNTQHGCTSCHGAHAFETHAAAVDACLQCHNDEHSLAYEASPHAKLWQSQQAGGLQQGSGVSCASCHMPRIEAGTVGTALAQDKMKRKVKDNVKAEGASAGASEISEEERQLPLIMVQHNQNWNLRPNEKMIRSVCMNCHSLEFSIDSLADEDLVRNNFSGRPLRHIESVDWAVARESEDH